MSDNAIDDAMRRANSRLGHAQCQARDALLIEMAIAIGNVAEPNRRKGIHLALKKFIDALSVPVPAFIPSTATHSETTS